MGADRGIFIKKDAQFLDAMLTSATGRDVLARVASFLDAPLALDCVGVNLAESTGIESHFSGKTFARIKLTGDYFVCGIRPNAIEPLAEPCDAEVISYQSPAKDTGRLVVREVKTG